MHINDYLSEVAHAVTTVMAELHAEGDQLHRLHFELTRLTAATDDGYRRAEFLHLNPELDDEGLGTAIHWDTYFGPDKERHYKADKVQAAQVRVAARTFSVAALSGSLLQYAKQGIAAQYGKERKGCPVGREIAGVALHEVIWQGRNQALHWEEGDFRPPVRKCFDQLAKSVDRVFAQYNERSMAYDLVRLLGWRTVDDFMRDMRLLA